MNRFISAAVLAAILTPVFALPASAWEESRFLGIDRNANDSISLQEAEDYRTRIFMEYDQNGDGRIEFEEYVKAEGLRPVTAAANSKVEVPDEYKEIDADDDMILMPEEMKMMADKRFKALDENGDGKISKDEFVSPGL